jgi:hypothetical protein
LWYVNVTPFTFCRLQTDWVAPALIVNVGIGLTTRFALPPEEHAPFVAVTEYKVVVAGLTTILSVVAPPGNHEIVHPVGAYVAVIVADCPEQIDVGVETAVIVGVAVTVIVCIALAVQVPTAPTTE